MAAAGDWDEWWRTNGERELALLLWAAWDPLDGAPIDEYEGYVIPLAELLQAKAPLDELALYLRGLRTRLDAEQEPERDLAIARKLQEWYRWSQARRR